MICSSMIKNNNNKHVVTIANDTRTHNHGNSTIDDL